jgi:hypothetical protein
VYSQRMFRRAFLIAALSIAAAGDPSESRLEILALLQTLNGQILAGSSATRTLEEWCADHRMADDPKIVARRVAGIRKEPSAEQLQRLGVRDASEVQYRRVELRCGTHLFSEADNWYVPARLTPEMNALLATTDTPFGKAVQPLRPYRHTIDATMLWTPLPGSSLEMPKELFRHRAVLYTADHLPFSEVVETYQSDLLAFRRPARRYHLQSNRWVNLHQRLLEEARVRQTPPPAGLGGADLARWKEIAARYRAFVAGRSPLFDAELVRIDAALSETTGDALPDSIPAVAAKALQEAMPLYRAAQWEQDDRANRFWIAVAEPLLASAGEELVAAHAKAYARPFPARVRVDVSVFAGQFGAYTVGEGESAHATISSAEPKNQGFAALEVLLHEPSHAVVDSKSGAIGEDLVRLSRELGIEPRHNLWHALLFYTSGELTRRALAARGVRDYQPYMTSMWDAQFRGMRPSIETHWQVYLDGRMSRDAALRRILVETGEPRSPAAAYGRGGVTAGACSSRAASSGGSGRAK